MKLQTFINKYGISHSIIAEHLGISRGSFSVKLREVNGQRLTEDQIEKAEKFVLQLIEDAKTVSFK